MEQNKKLSLKEEMEREANRIEQEITTNPELENVKVSDKMEASLFAKIQAYEKKRALEREEEDVQEKAAEEITGEAAEDKPNFSERTKDGNIVHLSEEDMEALRLGREMLKKKNNDELFEVDTNIHKHLNSGKKRKEGREKTGEKAKVLHMPRKKKVLLVLVAVCVLVLAIGVNSVGSKSYLKSLWNKLHGDEPMQIMNVDDMKTHDSEDGEEATAYRTISEKLGYSIIRFGYLPENMLLENYKIDEEQKSAQIFYKYEDEVIRYTMYINDEDSSLGQKEEDELIGKFMVTSSEQSIEVKAYDVKGYSKNRLVADFEYQGIYYQLKGIMEKQEFIEVVKNLIYFE